MKFARTLFLFLFFSFACACHLHAALSHPMAGPGRSSSAYSDHGVKLLNEGKTDLAETEFVKALLLDFSNASAETHLKKIAAGPEAGSETHRLYLLRFMELADFSRFLRARIMRFNDSNDRLVKFILQNKKSGEPVLKRARTIQSEIQTAADFLKAGPGLVKPGELPEKIDMEALNRNLLMQKQGLIEQLSRRKQINNQLRSLRIKVVRNMKTLKKEKISRGVGDQIAEIKMELMAKDNAFNAQDRNLSRLRDELGAVRHDFEQVQEKLVETDKRVAELTGELAKMSLESYEKDKILGDRDSRVKILENNLQDARQRLDLVQRIIQEKDEHIDMLEKEIGRFKRGEIAEETGGPEEQYAVGPQEESNLARIQSLERQFQTLNKKYLLMEAKIKAKDSAISRLKETVTQKNKKIITIKAVSLLKNYEMSKLNDIVRIYKEKLRDTHVDLMEKKRQLKQLEDQISEMEKLLDAAWNTDKFDRQAGLNNAGVWKNEEILDRAKHEMGVLQEYFGSQEGGKK